MTRKLRVVPPREKPEGKGKTEEQYLHPEFAPSRYETKAEFSSIGWCNLLGTTTVDLNTGEITQREQTFDPVPHSGVRLSTLEMEVVSLDLDGTVGRILDLEDMNRRARARMKHLKEHLGMLVGAAICVRGQTYEAGWDQEPALYYGPHREENNVLPHSVDLPLKAGDVVRLLDPSSPRYSGFGLVKRVCPVENDVWVDFNGLECSGSLSAFEKVDV